MVNILFMGVAFYAAVILLGFPLAANSEASRSLYPLQQELGGIEADAARLYGRMGLSRSASAQVERGEDPGRTDSLHVEADCRVARDAYHRGDYARADQAIARLGRASASSCTEARPFFHALVLLQVGRNREADAILSSGINYDDRDAWTTYNLGVAKLRQGDLRMGAGLMDLVGTMPAVSEEMLALRDQANLALGYGFLRADLGATARPLFRRVRLDGPYSSRALLGLGWSELAPDGAQQKNIDARPLRCTDYHSLETLKQNPEYRLQGRDRCSPVTAVNLRTPFALDPGGTTAEQRYGRALKAWQVLVARDPSDPAVQEALLAVAYVNAQLGLREQATGQYRHAVNTYESELERLSRLTRIVQSAITPAADPEDAWALRKPGDLAYLQDSFANPAFVAALEDYRELLALTGSLDRASGRLDALSPEPESVPAGTSTATAEAGTNDSPQPSGTPAQGQSKGLFMGIDSWLESLGMGADTRSVAAEESEQPAEVADHHERALQLRQRLGHMRTELATVTAAQESAIRKLPLQELAQRRTLLETYQAQARFSLARLLDPGAVSDYQDAEAERRDSP